MERIPPVLCSIAESKDDQGVDLEVSINGNEAQNFKASWYPSEGGGGTGPIQEELFFELSDLGVRDFANATIYQFELGHIVRTFLDGGEIPPRPITLGTTDFGFKRPAWHRVLRGRLWRIIHGYHPVDPNRSLFKSRKSQRI